MPPIHVKVLDNSDLKLATIQVSYAGVTKPSTPWVSNFYGGINELQQRYRDSYEETGADVKESGAETYADWIQRGPIYHYSFVRDVANRSSEVSITTTFTNMPNGPGTGTGSSGVARVFLVSHHRRNVQITRQQPALLCKLQPATVISLGNMMNE